jgi:hypothetical protein
MSREDIQTTKPGRVSNRPASGADRLPTEDLDYPASLGDLLPLEGKSNPASLLACLSGTPALLLGVACVLAVGGPHWLAWVDNPLANWASGLGGIAACLLGIGSLCGRSTELTGRAMLRASVGIVSGILAVGAACLAAFAHAMASITC